MGVPAEPSLGFLGHFRTWLFGGRQEEAALAFLDARIGGAAPERVGVEVRPEPTS